MAAKPPFIKSRSDFIGVWIAAGAPFSNKRDDFCKRIDSVETKRVLCLNAGGTACILGGGPSLNPKAPDAAQCGSFLRRGAATGTFP